MVKETSGENFGDSLLNINRKVVSWRRKREGSRVPNTNVTPGLKLFIEFEYYIIIYHPRETNLVKLRNKMQMAVHYE